MLVVPAQAGTHFRFAAKKKMDSGLRRDDGTWDASHDAIATYSQVPKDTHS